MGEEGWVERDRVDFGESRYEGEGIWGIFGFIDIGKKKKYYREI